MQPVVKPLYNRFDNRLYRVNKHPTRCQSGLTIMLNEQPLFVQPVVKPVVKRNSVKKFRQVDTKKTLEYY